MQLELRGTVTHYQQLGVNQRALVLLHGWGGNWESWHPVVAALSEHYQLIIPDLPGFGASRLQGQIWSSTEYAQWLRQFLEEVLGGKAFGLAGHSFGGKIAAVLAGGPAARHFNHHSSDQQRPAQQRLNLKKLVLVAAAGLPDPLPLGARLKQSLVTAVPRPLKEALPMPLKQRLLSQAGLATDHLLANPRQRQVFQEIFRENIAQSLVKIETPTLLVWGKNDTETPLEQGKKMAAHVPQSELVVLPESGHFPFVDQPQKFVEVVTNFGRW